MGNWADCIVSFFDLIGIRKKIRPGDTQASKLMQNLQLVVRKSMFDAMPSHDKAYVWNDSALFLAFPSFNSDYEKIMRELNAIKPKLDDICQCYAICVKGQAMPESVCQYDTREVEEPRFVFLKASSYALANCFEIEKELKKLKMDWYVDRRIVDKIPNFPKGDRYDVMMLPTNRKRGIYVLKGKIWE